MLRQVGDPGPALSCRGRAGRLLDILGVSPEARRFADLGASGRLAGGTRLPPPQPIFPRYVEEEVDSGAA
jgi:methionyl-tRNA synthetase